jgi:hypothetical protein
VVKLVDGDESDTGTASGALIAAATPASRHGNWTMTIGADGT